MGKDLNCGAVFIMEPSWKRNDEFQAIYRACHSGQTNDITVVTFAAPECDIEDIILKASIEKHQTSSALLKPLIQYDDETLATFLPTSPLSFPNLFPELKNESFSWLDFDSDEEEKGDEETGEDEDEANMAMLDTVEEGAHTLIPDPALNFEEYDSEYEPMKGIEE